MFLDPDEGPVPRLGGGGGQAARRFREAVGTDTEDPRFIGLIGELSLASPLFRRLGARHDILPRAGAVVPGATHRSAR